MRRLVAALVSMSWVAVPSVVGAEERVTSVMAVLGVATPVGELGVEVEHRIAGALSISGGVGLGLVGTQVAVMPRYEVGAGRARVAFGLGVSGGEYVWSEGWGWCFSDDCAERTSDLAVWGNAEMAIVAQAPGGFRLRGFIGYGVMLNPGALECPALPPPGDVYDDGSAAHCRADHLDDGERLPSFGMAMGYAF